jgi:hypothetical protein
MRRFVGCGAALAVIAGIAASGAHAAYVRGFEVRPGLPAVAVTAEPGEANDLKLIARRSDVGSPLAEVPASAGKSVLIVEDSGAPLTTGGAMPCRLLSPHRARCEAKHFYELDVFLQDGPDRVRMPTPVVYPSTRIYAADAGVFTPSRYTLRGYTEVSAGTGERVRFLPPGGGAVIIGGSPKLWLADGASEYVECRSEGDPRIVSDPFDEFSWTCSL